MGSVHYTGLLIGISFVVLIQFASGNGNVTLNGQCTDTSNCTTPHAECSVKNTCQCAATHFSPSSSNTTCSQKILVNGTCNANDSNQCADQHAKCSNNHGYRCLCSNTYYQKSSNCVPQISVNGTCNAKDSNQCADQHAKCSDNHGYRCLCSNTYYQKSSNCVPRIEVNVTCSNVNNECIENAVCDNKNQCQCKVGYTYRNKSCSGVSKMFIEISTIILAMLALRCNKWFVE